MKIAEYISYIKNIRRYSPRTAEIYRDSLEMFADFLYSPDAEGNGCGQERAIDENDLTPNNIRNFEVMLLEKREMSPRTVNLHLSVISGFCRYLVRQGRLRSNPAGMISRPKMEKRLPEFYRRESMEQYFADTASRLTENIGPQSSPKEAKTLYDRLLERTIISILYGTGMRRSELIGLNAEDVDFRRHNARVRGKGNKMREIPLTSSLCKEISLYLQAVETMAGLRQTAGSPLLLTFQGKRLYPGYVDRALKSGLGMIGSITGKKSPHVLRHTIATELLDDGADLNSIKELLGHSSLAATQVYTHNSIAKLKKVYETAHPRANKNGGNYGDQSTVDQIQR